MAPAHAQIIDQLRFGNRGSESAHHVVAGNNPAGSGLNGESFRKLLPPQQDGWAGGSMSFDIAVSANERTYVSLALSGDDANPNHLILLCDGKQIGARLGGEVDVADMGTQAPQHPGQFVYNSFPLPLSLTQGRKSLSCRLDSSGPIFPYGQTFKEFQLPMKTATRGIYAIYTHKGGFIDLHAPVGTGAPVVAKTAAEQPPGPEVLDRLKERVNASIVEMLERKGALRQPELQFLARAREVSWTKAASDPRVIGRLVDGFDGFYRAFRDNPGIVAFEPSTWNPEWFGFGPMGDVLSRHPDWFAAYLDKPVTGLSGAEIRRREAWSDMLVASREEHRHNRRFYSNQSQIVDTYGIYLCNRGVRAIAPARAMPEEQALDYLYQSVGLAPWRGDDALGGGSTYVASGPDGTMRRAYSVAPDYRQVTPTGLTRELGYVGNYGETLDWISAMYDATRPAPGQPGDALILAQLTKMARARGHFRYPVVDDAGHRVVRLEAVVGWRDNKYPGDVAYAQRPGWDGTAFQAATITRDPPIVAYAQQMLEDGQYFAQIAAKMETAGSRVTASLLAIPDEYEAIRSLPRQPFQLPMSQGQPDFTFSDPRVGVVAVKRGEERFFISLYWRASHAVNSLAKVHLIRPDGEWNATIHEDDVRFADSGLRIVKPSNVNPGFNNGLDIAYPGIVAADAGEALPIARPPRGVILKAGDDSPYAGRAGFYAASYAGYTIAMNMSDEDTHAFVTPAYPTKDLTSGEIFAAGSKIALAPQSTRILFKQ